MYVVLASVGGEQLTARLVGEPSLGSTSRSGRSAPRSESRWAIDHTIRTRWLSELTDDTIGWEPAAASESAHHES